MAGKRFPRHFNQPGGVYAGRGATEPKGNPISRKAQSLPCISDLCPQGAGLKCRGVVMAGERFPRHPHHMRTFFPSIIASRAFLENASNSSSVMRSIAPDASCSPAAIARAVGTPRFLAAPFARR